MKARALATAALVAWSTPLVAQSTAVTVELSADSIGMAEVFELHVRFDVPPGSAVYFSDTIPATADVESSGSVDWREERSAASGEGAVVVLTYPLMSFGSARVAVPTPSVLIGPVGDAEGDAVAGGSVVGAWSDAPAVGSRRFRRIRIPEPGVWVRPVRSEAEIAAGTPPRGPDDVLGASWSWPHLMLVGFFSSILAVAGHAKSREWLANRKSAAAPLGPLLSSHDARLAALAEIDRLIAAGPYAAEREKGVYAASSDVLRGYVARLGPDWVPGLTSTEQMAPFEAEAKQVTGAMATAERVKFGRHRTGSGPLQAHLSTLRAWLEEPRA
jgi:hypothetical protein